MATTLRIRRRLSGSAGAPSALKTAELAYNQVDGLLYIGYGDDGNGNATSIKVFAKDNYTDPSLSYQPLNQTLSAISGLSSAGGILAKTGTNTVTQRTLSGTTGRLAVTNGDGVAGNPTFDLATVAVGTAVNGGSTKFTVDGYGRVTNAGQASFSDLAVPTADVSAGGFKFTNVAAGVNPTDAVNMSQLLAVKQAVKFKEPARLSGGAANITISNPGTSTFDGKTANTGDTVLLFNQTNSYENGKYYFNGSSAAMTRTEDADTWAKLLGAVIGIEEGSATYADTARLFTADIGGTLGTTALPTTSFGAGSSSAFSTAGNGLYSPTANTVAVNPGVGISTASGKTDLTGQAAALHQVATAADQVIYATGSATFAVTAFTSFGRSLVGAANAAGAQSTLGLGTMATQNATSVAITGGTIDGVVLDGGTF